MRAADSCDEAAQATKPPSPFRRRVPAPAHPPTPHQPPPPPLQDAREHSQSRGMGVGTATTTDRESFYARILAEGPSMDEVAAHATPAYVTSLMETIGRNREDTERLLAAIDQLRQRREERYLGEARTAREQAAELHTLRQRISQVTLQLQEERERSTRLLHENTVLYTQEAEQRERLAALVELAQSRGRALQQLPQRRRGANSSSPPAASTLNASPASPPLPTNSLSLRAMTSRPVPSTSGGDTLAGLNTSVSALGRALPLPHRTGQERSHARDDVGNDGDDDDHDAELLTALRPAASTAAAHLVALTEEVQALRQQLDEQRVLYERERGVRVEQEREAHAQAQEVQSRQLATIQQLEELHECALKDLVTYRHRTDRELRDLRGQVDWLKQSLSEAIGVAESAKRQHHVSATAMTLRAEDHYRPKMRSLVMELTSRRQSTQAMRRQFEQALAEKDTLTETLRDALAREKAGRKRAEERHRLEVQGVRSELDMMRQSLRQVEKKVFFARAREAAAMAEEQNLMEHYYPA